MPSTADRAATPPRERELAALLAAAPAQWISLLKELGADELPAEGMRDHERADRTPR